MLDVLEKLFGSAVRVKIMRLFLFNQDLTYEAEEVVGAVRGAAASVKKELNALEKIGMLSKRTFIKEIEKKPAKTARKKKTESEPKTKIIKKKVVGYELNLDFVYNNALKNLLIGTMPISENKLMRKLGDGGRLKLVIIAGTLIQEWDDARVDVLVVGDRLKPAIIEGTVRSLEAEIGKELRCAVFDTNDFEYRLSVCDKLVRDVLEYPHKRLLDKLNIPENTEE